MQSRILPQIAQQPSGTPDVLQPESTQMAAAITSAIAVYDLLEIVATETVHPEVIDDRKGQERHRMSIEKQIASEYVSEEEKERLRWNLEESGEGWSQKRFVVTSAIRSLWLCGVSLLVAAVVFIFHWRMAKRESGTQ
jgi:hypothetical protein